MPLRTFVRSFALLGSAVAVVVVASFFHNFSTTLSDWSGFGFSWTVQMFHNFAFGRPFQSSLFAGPDAGSSVGFLSNPHAFIHANVIHVNVVPYLFAELWAMWPRPDFIYGLIFAWNALAGVPLLRAVLRARGCDDPDRFLFAAAAYLGGGLWMVLSQMGQMLLFAGPFMLAVYYAFLARRWALFVAAGLALALTSEDAAMVGAAFGAHLFAFGGRDRRWGAVLAVLSLVWLALVLGVFQPFARRELEMTHSTTAAIVVGKLWELGPAGLGANLASMAPLIPGLVALPLAVVLFGAPGRRESLEAAAAALVPALPHWGECVVVGGAHHLLPPAAGLALALTVVLSATRGARRPGAAAALLAAAFFAASVRVNAGNLPVEVKPALYRLAGKSEKAAATDAALALEKGSNLALIAAAGRLPADATLVFWGNNRALGFLSARSGLWEFPDQYGRTDYLLVQKDATDANYSFSPGEGEGLRAALARRSRLNVRGQRVSAAAFAAVRADLTSGGLYRVAQETDGLALFERVVKEPIPSPPSTYGWRWAGARG